MEGVSDMVTGFVVTDSPRRDAETFRASQPTVGARGASLKVVSGGVVIVRRPDGTAIRFEPKEFQR
jgi:hypothetical protein